MSQFRSSALFALLATVAIISLLLLMPLGMAASAMGLSARSSNGTILSGSLRDVTAANVRIGDVNARLRLLPLALGRLSFAIHRGDAPHLPGVSGNIGTGLGGRFVENLTATLDGGAMVPGLEGSSVRLETLSAQFSGDRCHSASGTVRLSLDDTPLGPLIRGGLMGNARCSNGDLLLPLISASGMERATLRLSPTGKYQATLLVSDPSPETAVALGLAGFQPAAGGMRLLRTGTIG